MIINGYQFPVRSSYVCNVFLIVKRGLAILRQNLNLSLLQLLGQLVNLLVLELDNGLLLGLLGLLDELLGSLLGLNLLLFLLFLFSFALVFKVAEAINTPFVLDDDVAGEILLALVEKLLQNDNGLVFLGELVAVELDSPESGEGVLGGSSETLKTGRRDVIVLKAQGLKLLVLALGQGTGQKHTALCAQQRVSDAELTDHRPCRGNLGEGLGSHEGEGVVLKVKHSQLGGVVQALADEVRDTLLADAILDHLDLLDLVVQAEGLGPRRHAAVLEAVAPADDRLQVGHLLAILAGGFLLGVQL